MCARCERPARGNVRADERREGVVTIGPFDVVIWCVGRVERFRHGLRFCGRVVLSSERPADESRHDTRLTVRPGDEHERPELKRPPRRLIDLNRHVRHVHPVDSQTRSRVERRHANDAASP